MWQSTTISVRMKYNNVPIKEIIVGLIQPECGGEDAPTLSQGSPGNRAPGYGPVVLDTEENMLRYRLKGESISVTGKNSPPPPNYLKSR